MRGVWCRASYSERRTANVGWVVEVVGADDLFCGLSKVAVKVTIRKRQSSALFR